MENFRLSQKMDRETEKETALRLLAEMGERKPRKPPLSAKERKRRYDQRRREQTVYIGKQADRWQKIGHAHGLATHEEIAKFLIDRYHAGNQPKSVYYVAEQNTRMETESEEENLVVRFEPISPDAGYKSKAVGEQNAVNGTETDSEDENLCVKFETSRNERCESPAVDVKLKQEPVDPSIVTLEEQIVHSNNTKSVEDGKIFATNPHNENSEPDHPKIIQSKCLSCGAGLPQFDLLAEMYHKGKKLHVCEKCGSAFAIYSNMVHHMMMRWHIGCKPVRCQNCGQCFQKASLS